jgi:hypothetical protein
LDQIRHTARCAQGTISRVDKAAATGLHPFLEHDSRYFTATRKREGEAAGIFRKGWHDISAANIFGLNHVEEVALR